MGDHVVIECTNTVTPGNSSPKTAGSVSTTYKVIGFKDHPKGCGEYLEITISSGWGTSVKLIWDITQDKLHLLSLETDSSYIKWLSGVRAGTTTSLFTSPAEKSQTDAGLILGLYQEALGDIIYYVQGQNMYSTPIGGEPDLGPEYYLFEQIDPMSTTGEKDTLEVTFISQYVPGAYLNPEHLAWWTDHRLFKIPYSSDAVTVDFWESPQMVNRYPLTKRLKYYDEWFGIMVDETSDRYNDPAAYVVGSDNVSNCNYKYKTGLGKTINDSISTHLVSADMITFHKFGVGYTKHFAPDLYPISIGLKGEKFIFNLVFWSFVKVGWSFDILGSLGLQNLVETPVSDRINILDCQCKWIPTKYVPGQNIKDYGANRALEEKIIEAINLHYSSAGREDNEITQLAISAVMYKK